MEIVPRRIIRNHCIHFVALRAQASQRETARCTQVYRSHPRIVIVLMLTLFTDNMAKLNPQLSADASKTSALDIQSPSIAQGIGMM
jgi:hypothetical protein